MTRWSRIGFHSGDIEKVVSGHDFTNAAVYYNDFNCMFYIHARMRKRRSTGEKTNKTDKTGIEKSRFI